MRCQAEEEARLAAEKEEVEGIIAEQAVRDRYEELDGEEEEVMEKGWGGADWCQRCIRRLASDPEHECEMGLEKMKCAYCVRQGRGRQGGIDACWLVSVCYLSCFRNANLSLVVFRFQRCFKSWWQ